MSDTDLSRRQALEEALQLEQQLQAHRAKQGLLGFILTAYPNFQPSWHHRRLAQAANALARGQTPRQLLTRWGLDDKALGPLLAEPHPVTGLYAGMSHPDMLDQPIDNLQVWLPPRHSKTAMMSIALPSWWLGNHPDHQLMAATYGRELTDEMSTAVLNTMTADTYRGIFPDTSLQRRTIGSEEQRARMTIRAFDVAGRRGKYRATSIGAAATGRGADLLLVDDPFKNRKSAESARERQTVWDWWRSTAYTRGQKGARRVLCNTRWSYSDLSALSLQVARSDPQAAQWFVVCYPAILDSAPTPGDPRQMGEALWPEFFPLKTLDQTRRTIGLYEWDALYQQRPSIQGGSVVKDAWWQYYSQLPEGLSDWTISCDLTFGSLRGESEQGDYVAMMVWAAKGADRYLVDLLHERLDFTQQVRALRALSHKHPQCRQILVEDAASARAVIRTLRSEVAGLIAVRPQGSKQVRVDAVSPQIEAGNVYLPAPTIAPWVEKVRAEFSAFPAGAHDDIVDATSLALYRMRRADVPYATLLPQGSTRKSPWM